MYRHHGRAARVHGVELGSHLCELIVQGRELALLGLLNVTNPDGSVDVLDATQKTLDSPGRKLPASVHQR